MTHVEQVLLDHSNVFIFADFSQIELRVMAELSRDANMVAAFMAGEDIHASTAKRLLGVTDEWIANPDNKAEFVEVRRRAKALNFGVLFGEGANKIAQDLSITVEEAKKLIESYFIAYPGVAEYIQATHREAERTGQVRNMFGRIRHLPDIVHLASIQMPRYKTLMLTEDEQKLFYGRLFGTGKPPSCYLGEDDFIFPPTISGHLGYDMERLVAGRRPPKTEALRAKLVATTHGQTFSKCAECPYLAPCAWEGEFSRRRAKLQRNRRQAFNARIQSTAVSMGYHAWRQIEDRIVEEKIPAHGTRRGLAFVPIQVHDSLGVIVAKTHAEQMKWIVIEEMERWPNEKFPDWKVPIKIDISEAVVSWDEEK